MSSNFKNLYTSNNPPLQATLMRGSNIESIHKIHAVINDKKGRVLMCAGNPEYKSFIRSALKPFQAEDGIRDFSRSRGLGDVYKRQSIRLYLGWNHIFNRLISEKVEYEESGWYDGQVWEKPLVLREKESLIASIEVKPILKNLIQIFSIISVLALSGILIFQYNNF